MAKDNLPSRIRAWRGCYENLLNVAAEHAAYLEQLDEDWAGFPALTSKWAEGTAETKRMDEELRAELGDERYEELFRIEALPLVVKINELTDQSIVRMRNEMAAVGGDLKNTRDHRKVMNAYYGMDRQNDTSYYFDRKK
ncbi:hypothetical protein [Cohnella fermenti]|uniref:Flagellar protein FliT n=1 Tax=Cohnella fermenti TaxID=2565925 RepID=A0A4V3WFM4_9BACL|nr:hypothetical protein [Cohnella fermenti]THF80802.1 hypothetical protein E6C55_09975 [Cohnella fermenti]